MNFVLGEYFVPPSFVPVLYYEQRCFAGRVHCVQLVGVVGFGACFVFLSYCFVAQLNCVYDHFLRFWFLGAAWCCADLLNAEIVCVASVWSMSC